LVTCTVSIKLQDAASLVRWSHIDADHALPLCASFLLILAKRAVHVELNITLYARKEKRYPSLAQGWAFKMEVTPAASSWFWI